MKSTKWSKKEPAQLLIIFPLYFYRFVHIPFSKTTGFCQMVSLLPNCIRFSPFSHIPTAFSDKIIYLSAKIHSILSLFTFSRHMIAETPDFCQIVYFCQIVSIAMLSAVSKSHKKRGSPTAPVNPSIPEIP